jgi:hypothetical protein
MRLGLCLALLIAAGCVRPNDSYGPASLASGGPDLGSRVADDLSSASGEHAGADLAAGIDLVPVVPDLGHVKGWCPPEGTSAASPPELGDLVAQKCDYDCWGRGTLYNMCGIDQYQFCLHSGVFAPCQFIQQ